MRNLLIVGLLIVGLIPQANATNSTFGAMNNSASVPNSCVISVPLYDETFSYSPITGGTLSGSGYSLYLSCTKGTTGEVKLVGGGTTLTGPNGETLTYQLQKEMVEGGLTWTDQPISTFTSTSTALMGVASNRVVIPGGQDVSPGTYSDTITFQISF